MKRLSGVSFLIPAYNDAGTIKQVIEEAAEVGKQVASSNEILVIDDGSTDNTREILYKLKKQNKQLKIFFHDQNEGYGKTIKELYYKGASEWLFSIPGDYQVGAKELYKLIPYIKNSDMNLGWRKERHDPFIRIFQSWLYNHLIQLLFGIRLHDVNSVRFMRRSMLQTLQLTSDSAYVDAELAIKAKEAGYHIREVPIGHRDRIGSSGGGGSLVTIVSTITEMLQQFRKDSSIAGLKKSRS